MSGARLFVDPDTFLCADSPEALAALVADFRAPVRAKAERVREGARRRMAAYRARKRGGSAA